MNRLAQFGSSRLRPQVTTPHPQLTRHFHPRLPQERKMPAVPSPNEGSLPQMPPTPPYGIIYVPVYTADPFCAFPPELYSPPPYAMWPTPAMTAPPMTNFGFSGMDLLNNFQAQSPLEMGLDYSDSFSLSSNITWLNRQFCKASTEEEWEMCLETVRQFQNYSIEITPETGTLLIKSACRLDIPEKALAVMKNLNYRTPVTLSGIHYLMINFSQKKDSKNVMEAFDIISLRNLKPNAKTYHILIRECSDNGSFDQAIKFADRCRKEQIVPNRVTFNILMNGYRKLHKPDEILTLRAEMDDLEMELNDTTSKFTALAYMMKGDPEKAVHAFLQTPSIKNPKELDSFCSKLIETANEDNYFHKLVVDLFQKVQSKIRLPNSVREWIKS